MEKNAQKQSRIATTLLANKVENDIKKTIGVENDIMFDSVDTENTSLMSMTELAELADELKSVKSITELRGSLASPNEDFKPTYDELIKTGRIGESLYMYFDYNREKYILLDKETGDRKVLNTASAGHKLFEVFVKYGIELKNPQSDLKYVKKVIVDFDLKRPEYWTTSMGDFLNEFQEQKTKLGVISELRKEETERYKNLAFLKNNCKAIYSLLFNLHENNDDAVRHFINYLSTFVNEREKIPTAFMYAGIEGAGKGILVSVVLSYILGDEYTTSQMASSLKKDFNGSLENKLLVNFNEVSSDFSKTDSATQNLKSLITDNTFSLNVKNQKEFDAKNNFIVILSQNIKTGVKISLTDRRFNYFVQERTLKDVAEKDFKKSIKVFIEENIKSELDNFVRFIALYDYDKYTAQDLFETESKRRAQVATSSSFDVLIKQLKERDLMAIVSDVEDIVNAYNESDDKKKYTDNYYSCIRLYKTALNDLEDELEKDCISNKTLTCIYTILIEDASTKTDRLLNKIFESHFGKSIVKTINGETKRVRSLKSSFDEKEVCF
jgi:hypothetical protein